MKKKKISLFNIALSLLLVSILGMGALLIFVKPSNHKPLRRNDIQDTLTAGKPSPVFRKDGELTFRTQKGKDIIKIDVEVADDEAERTQGLMYRDSMAENTGMIFLFPIEEPMSFWMKNTHIPLDIIYINSEKKIVHIAENTKPYSLDQIPSGSPALFVVEVNAGFTKRHGIKVGDTILY
jgi:uncharacterized protein